jgi:hypothetical protein
MDQPFLQLDGDATGRPGGSQSLANGGFHPIEGLILCVLPPLGIDTLMEIALRIHEAKSYERDAQIAGLLTMVSGQDTEPTAINRDRIMKPELGREISNHTFLCVRIAVGIPGILRGDVFIEQFQHGEILADEGRVLAERDEPFRFEFVKQLDGIVMTEAPECGVNGLE